MTGLEETCIVQNAAPEPNPFGYSPAVWQRFQLSPRAGAFTAQTIGLAVGQSGTRASRSVLRLEFRFEEGRVADARFRAYGCPTSIAVGAWIAEWAIGKDAAELSQLRAADLRAALEIADDRAHCAVMGEDALRHLLTKL